VPPAGPREDPSARRRLSSGESRNPTQGLRQGNDVGSQYRSVIFYGSDGQRAAAEAGYGEITTEIVPAGEFYFAEDYHQQYLSSNKNPNGYCPDHGTGVSCPIGVAKASGPLGGVKAAG
jgi:peptide-methionine (S)-S-oxide reductase